MEQLADFKAFPKITRFWEQEIVVTEKIDGTNGVIRIDAEGNVRAGSRSRWIFPNDDNYGFAMWVHDNQDDLQRLGEGTHYGEWWGQGIQRGYNMDKKVFSLFNTHRWGMFENRPSCCDVVPVLFRGVADDFYAWASDNPMLNTESQAVLKYNKEFKNPEGYMMYFTNANMYMKVPLSK